MIDNQTRHADVGADYYLAGLTALVIIAISLIILADSESESAVTNATVIATAAMAAGAGTMVISKSSNSAEKRLYALISVALILWLAAESLWTFYEIVLGIEMPYPSLSDVLWLGGYVPFIVYMTRTYRSIGSKVTEHRLLGIFLATVTMSMIISIFLLPIFKSALPEGDLLTLGVSLAYPTLDAILLSISILTVASIRPASNGYPLMPAILILVGIIAFVIADTGFGYNAVADPELLESQDKAWNALYASSYLCLAGALYWYYRVILPAQQTFEKRGFKAREP